MPQHPTDHQSILVQVMAWCHQATSHYMSQCWPISLSPYDVTRPQWVNPEKLTSWHFEGRALDSIWWANLSPSDYTKAAIKHVLQPCFLFGFTQKDQGMTRSQYQWTFWFHKTFLCSTDKKKYHLLLKASLALATVKQVKYFGPIFCAWRCPSA